MWKHLQDLYHQDSGAQKSAGGLSLVPKLKYEHVYLTSFSKMRVDLAAQVSYNTVIVALLTIYIMSFSCLNLGTQQLSGQSPCVDTQSRCHRNS